MNAMTTERAYTTDSDAYDIFVGGITPSCPYCGHNPTRRHGTTKAGVRRYYCPNCRRSWTGTPHGGQNKVDDGLKSWERQCIKRKKSAL
jgi:transposase-like protein